MTAVGEAAGRGAAAAGKSRPLPPHRCCAACRVTPSRAAISAQLYPLRRSPATACRIASSSSPTAAAMSVIASMSPAATRRAQARRTRRANAAYSSFSVTRRRRRGVKARLTPGRAPESGGVIGSSRALRPPAGRCGLPGAAGFRPPACVPRCPRGWCRFRSLESSRHGKGSSPRAWWPWGCDAGMNPAVLAVSREGRFQCVRSRRWRR